MGDSRVSQEATSKKKQHLVDKLIRRAEYGGSAHERYRNKESNAAEIVPQHVEIFGRRDWNPEQVQPDGKNERI